MERTTDKIMMIKHLRILTRVLGKLGINRLRRDGWMWYQQQIHLKAGQLNHIPILKEFERYDYGWGLKESKDYVERILDRKARTTTT